MDTQNLFWTNVKDLLKDKGMSQSDLCNLINKPLASLQQQIHHDRIPTADEALIIAKSLNTNIEYLLTGVNHDRGDKLAADIQKIINDYMTNSQE